ncbi:hypothetical protein E2C01_094835 [Portunus trituberculatus]|uniref:Uncharacterized protein n=1 Tax=Portunus trituberculatus TaxID=210409 RepID=A0A5B7JTJ3_PORTR|nr:hypothetical protein [Portunus trituberculatus]
MGTVRIVGQKHRSRFESAVNHSACSSTSRSSFLRDVKWMPVETLGNPEKTNIIKRLKVFTARAGVTLAGFVYILPRCLTEDTMNAKQPSTFLLSELFRIDKLEEEEEVKRNTGAGR